MTAKHSFACLILGLIVASPTFGQSMTGNELKRMCDDDALELGCLAYIRGALETYQFVGFASEEFVAICYPDGVSTGQITDVVRKYINDTPEDRHLSAYFLAIVAVAEIWRCRESDETPRPE